MLTFYNEVDIYVKKFRDMIDSAYTEINNLGMKPVISAMCDVKKLISGKIKHVIFKDDSMIIDYHANLLEDFLK